MTLILPDLPYAMDALAPYMSAETLEFHHGKHHRAYVDKGNDLLAGTAFEGKPVDDIVRDASEGALLNNVAQAWNHAFFWESMAPGGGGDALPGAVEAAVKDGFGSLEAFKGEFTAACVAQFGSGWGWLVRDPASGRLEILKTGNADTPARHGKVALLTCDVWEHAYYIDYRNARPKYVEAFLGHLVDWERVAQRLEEAA
jgi:superoxide dismutase, Fe-Mn family